MQICQYYSAVVVLWYARLSAANLPTGLRQTHSIDDESTWNVEGSGFMSSDDHWAAISDGGYLDDEDSGSGSGDGGMFDSDFVHSDVYPDRFLDRHLLGGRATTERPLVDIRIKPVNYVEHGVHESDYETSDKYDDRTGGTTMASHSVALLLPLIALTAWRRL